MPDLYRIFDATLSCDFALPELSRATGGEPLLTVQMGQGDVEQFAGLGFETAFEWRNNEDEVVCWVERRVPASGGDEYLYVFPRSASFHIGAGGAIKCFLHAGATDSLLRHLLLNQIVPRYLASTGRLLLHASAVTLKNGKSVAFLGNSGFGKSTLVSSFHRHGAQLINDDCILLECTDEGVTAIGGLVGIRLFPDSVNAVFTETAGFTNYTPYTDKQQLFLQDQVGDGPPQPCVLDTMFVLDNPKIEQLEGEEINGVSIAPVAGTTAMMAMIFSAFSLDPSDKQAVARNFRNVGQAISEHLNMYSLSYPRTHDRLAEVRAAVVGQIK